MKSHAARPLITLNLYFSSHPITAVFPYRKLFRPIATGPFCPGLTLSVMSPIAYLHSFAGIMTPPDRHNDVPASVLSGLQADYQI